MNKNLLFIALAASAIAMQSCDKEDDLTATTIPTAVADSFSAKYPTATLVSWERERGYYVADFHDENNYEVEAWFDKAGSWQLTETDIPVSALPTPVKDAFYAGTYATWQIDDVDMFEKPNQPVYYVIDVESGNREKHLHYAADGTLTKE